MSVISDDEKRRTTVVKTAALNDYGLPGLDFNAIDILLSITVKLEDFSLGKVYIVTYRECRGVGERDIGLTSSMHKETDGLAILR